MQRNLCLIIPLFIIGPWMLGCGEGGDHVQIRMAHSIIGLAKVRGTLYLADGHDGVWRFNNKTESWEFTDYWYPVHRIIAINDTLYLHFGGVECLNPDGNTFTEITAPVFSHLLELDGDYFYSSSGEKLLRHKKEGGDRWLELNTSWDDHITAIVVKGNTIFASTFNLDDPYNSKYRLFGSVDGGHSWTEINGFPDITDGFLIHPLHLYQNTLYIATSKGVYRLLQGTSSSTPAGLDGRGVLSIVASETTLYASTWGDGVFRSNDGGNSWHSMGLTGIRVMGLDLVDNRLYVGGGDGEGVFYTDDEGGTWHRLNKGLNLPSDEE